MIGIYRVPSGKGAAEGDNRVLRGGSWNNDNSNNFRCANRNNNTPDNRNNNNGFRCASTLPAGVRTSTEAGACPRESRLLPGCAAVGVAEYQRRTGGLVASRAKVTRD
ncbi:MAG: SUMF1/EgtB/PvdO family nonheme iron enzyme [Acidobacteria bacterium]|nr:SUMF1/EgtB/PvdO family nonheme iron enzyme [Acidobacteriota bacterium]